MTQEPREPQARPDKRVQMEFKAPLVRMDRMELTVLLAATVLWGLLVLLALRVPTEPLVLLALSVQTVNLVLKVRRATQVRKVRLDLPALLVLRVRRVRRPRRPHLEQKP